MYLVKVPDIGEGEPPIDFVEAGSTRTLHGLSRPGLVSHFHSLRDTPVCSCRGVQRPQLADGEPEAD